jgi:hypothetical protein
MLSNLKSSFFKQNSQTMNKLIKLTIGLLFFCTQVFAQTQQNPPSLLEHLQQHGIEEFRLAINFDTLEAYRKKDASFKAKVQFKGLDDQLKVWDVDVNVRGRFRRTFCEMPPLKLNFSKKDLLAAGFSPYDELKLTCQCTGDPEGENLLFKEYLTYGLYEQLSPYAFQTHLLNIKYVNTADHKTTKRGYAFVIENDKEFGDRLGLKECKNCLVPAPQDLDLASENLVATFQYMIGNEDWGTITGQKNVKFFRKNDDGKLIVVPHDFDFSSLVGAAYAKKKPSQPNAIMARQFKGLQADAELQKQTMRLFRNKREAMEAFIQNSPLLSEEASRTMANYLGTFYDRPSN